MTTLRKSYPIAEFKALSQPGEFEALVSVFGNVDLQGDRVVQGAFTKSLQRWRESGDPIPIIWSHDWGNPHAHIGAADPLNVKQSPQGLRVTGQLDLENPFAAQVYHLMKTRRVKEFSFSYEVVREKMAADSANELLDLELIEVGPTLKGANPETELVGVKAALEEAAGLKAGRTISKTNENKIRGAITTLEEVLTSIQDSNGVEDAKSVDDPENTAEESAEEPVVEEPVEDVDLIAGITADIELMRTRFALGGSR